MAPLDVSVMVLGEPFKAWAQALWLLNAISGFGGGTTFTVAIVCRVQPFKLPVSV